ncbi:hypothetical protein [Cryptosporangium sp. NPDC048952]|uniref:hypothetical protein n=1 Tax=Cryptosporangium sp. NPDC048952 TaxID=3363961 RepID=UPI00370FB5CC
MTRNGEPGRWGRPLAAACAAAAVLIGLVLAASAVLGGAGGVPVAWVLLCCVPGAGFEGALLRTTPRHRAVLVVTVVAALVAGAVVWSGGAALLAAVTALTYVPVVIANVLPSRGVRAPAAVFRVLVAVGLLGVMPATDTAAPAFWSVAAAATATALTIHALHRQSSPRPTPLTLRP